MNLDKTVFARDFFEKRVVADRGKTSSRTASRGLLYWHGLTANSDG